MRDGRKNLRRHIVNNEDYITLKWGTLKSWKLTSDRGYELLKQYHDLGMSMGAAQQHDTPEQKHLICEMIDIILGDIYLDWDDKYVSKEEAKQYVMGYGSG